jgi:stage II sporulation protein GA (sporulation sigma-E factor processing peptidase)
MYERGASDCEGVFVDIYLDILILENIIINYFILVITARFVKRSTVNLRLFLAACIGAAFVVIMVLMPGMKIYYSAIAKFLLSLLIIAVAFSPEKIKEFIKVLVSFYVSTFIFAGAAFALLYANQTGGFVRNGVFYIYWRSKWTVIVLSLLLTGIILRIFWEVIRIKFVREKLLTKLKIFFDDRKIFVPALIDTGNSLYDPLTNMPVVVVEFSAIKELLPGDIKGIYERSGENNLSGITEILSQSKWISRFRLIPFTSLGKENGMLLGFKPDYLEIGEDGEIKSVKDVIIAIYNKSLSSNQSYRALLNPELI